MKILSWALPAFVVATSPPSSVDEVLSSPAVERAMAIVDESQAWSVERLVALTEIPAPPFAETERGKAFAAALRELGCERVWTDEVGNVYGERPGTEGDPVLVLSAHLDTVFPAGTDTTVRREGSVLAAPGVGDDTVGLATILTVLKALEEADVSTRGTILFVGTVGEEGRGDLRGVKHLFLETPLKDTVDFFVSVDGTGDETVTSRALGSRRYRVTYRGPGGHSWSAFGTPNPGFAMARTLAALAELEAPPGLSYNVGVLGGGTSVNSIPYEVWMEIDLRAERPELLRETEERFLAWVDEGVARENAIRSRNGTVEADKELIGDRPSGETPDDAPIVRTAVELTRRIVGVDEVRLRRGSTDANVPISLGIPAITIGGGGKGEGAHSPRERFDTTDWPRGIKRVLALAVALAGLAGPETNGP